ncbi:proline iminopeptidase-family hydrolase [Xanthomonas melonis]|uniref:Proline iminopeptidase-family hydrolase n=1 Tax=Xanthomonas melonis TaxID=56456 RepID=A0ABS8NV94_9XANT|nr:proline iminopeptidase-family hydrolase [Xanthomonas melonis]MCD0260085.1 proline iminopeptidase-family hydrolase [Xanthomonas melonis]MCD0267013.1 proline iminopeptidase-family hydrolase [Xanthomonas melonis]
MQSTEGYVEFRGYRTWYRITGDLRSDACPLVVLHGGPGCTHDYVDSFRDLAAGGRAVIHYDQLGNGRSTHLPNADPGFWTVGLFLDELQALITHLGLARYALLGQSWGGMLAAEHAVRRPAGLCALVIANSPASMGLWRAAALRLRAELPEPVQAVLDEHEAAGTLDHPAYRAASQVFYARHVCRVLPWPDEVARTFAAIDADPTVYHAMNGPTEFHVVGSLRNWSIIERLHRINAPTLVLSGRYDEATAETVEPYARLIPDARWHVFAQSSHMPHVEERVACMRLVGDFLDDHTPWAGSEVAGARALASPSRTI